MLAPTMHIHASCAARNGQGVLLLGPPGSGKSDLVLRLLDLGFCLVADDQVDLRDGQAYAPTVLAGLLEVRGLGILRLPYQDGVPVRLAVVLGRGARMPEPRRHEALDIPVVTVDPAAASAPSRIALALDCALGRVTQVAGAFA